MWGTWRAIHRPGGYLASRIIVAFKQGERDPLGLALGRTISNFLGIKTKSVRTRRAYIIDADLPPEELGTLERDLLVDPVTERSAREMEDGFDWLIEVSYKAGVTNPVSKTATRAANEILGLKLREENSISTATQYLISGATKAQAERIARELLSNPTVESARILGSEEIKAHGLPILQFQINGTESGSVRGCSLDVSDAELLEISRKGVLALSLQEMKVIQKHVRSPEFRRGRKAIGMDEEFWDRLTDAELEAIAQTQSEHCKHKIFNSMITYVGESGKEERIDGLFKTYIRSPSLSIAKQYGWVLSAFHDNAGIVDMGNGILIADKLETHNAPSALEPYGGAITGILGVNRDILGAGMGAKPLFNVFGYCFGDPFLKGTTREGVLHPARIRSGVHRGVIDGGNQSGIPLVGGLEIFDWRFGFRPLVFCGTIGILPKKTNGRPSEEKKASPGDLIVMVGGRIGKDGIHGATFSSSGLDRGSPVQAVQIGDSITQRRMTDFLVEARDKGLYKSITDNGAGGLSSSVGEMAKETNGFRMDLKKAPLKYLGLAPFEILISESQERMTVAVEPSRIAEFLKLAADRDVEATALGEFEDTGKFHVTYGDRTIAYLDMRFIHDGFPQMKLKAKWKARRNEEPGFKQPRDLDAVMEGMLSRLNVCSKEYKLRQYDHEVKARSVVKPLVGKDLDSPSDATVSLLEYGGKRGLIAAQGINPHYSDIDTYHMTASVIDEAVRRVIAVGGKLPSKGNVFYGLDNFCWNISSLESEDGEFKLGQLVRANKALSEYCKAFGIPCISGKDSMKNVWKAELKSKGRKAEKLVSIPPTLLFSARARMDDVGKAVTMDAKRAGDLVYVIGETFDELGASEYFSYMAVSLNKSERIGNKVPKVDAAKAMKTYAAVSAATDKGLASSLHTPTFGGIGIALAQSAFAGGLGIEADLRKVPYRGEDRDDYVLFSQSNSRFIATVSPKKAKAFEKAMAKAAFAKIGVVTKARKLKVYGLKGGCVINSDTDRLKSAWKGTLEGV